MQWLPPCADVRSALHEAMAAPEVKRLAKLAALAGHRLSYFEILQLDRAVSRLVADPPTGWARVRLAIIGSATLNHLAPAIRVAGLRRQVLFDTFVGHYGQYRQEVLDRTSELHQFAPEVVLLSLGAGQLVGSVPLGATSSEAECALGTALDELGQLWRSIQQSLGADVIQQTFLDVAEPVFGSFEARVPGSAASLTAQLNARIAAASATAGVHLLDIARQVQRDGLSRWYDLSRWLQAKMEIAPSATPMFGELVARVIAAQRGLSRKCLVLDLDNTLWGGVIGDDGIGGIVLGEGSAAGEAHLALQRYARQLGERGVILAVCSKNDPAIAEAAFRDHPEMVLRPPDIAVFIANWEDKAVNLKRIASRLNIGVDSLVFVDDNPAERDRVRQALPGVAVPELPGDVAGYVGCLADAGYFEAIAFTTEDRQRGEQYAANAAREALLEASGGMDEYLRSLGMVLDHAPFQDVDQARVTQLINKTNQFNPTTRRYTQKEVSAVSTSPVCLTLQLRLADRFGDNGLVSALILQPVEGRADQLEMDTWVMSCRVFGRQLEHEALNLVVEAARSRGVTSLRADYLPTAKNGVVGDLYPRLGFRAAEEVASVPGATRWVLDLADYAPLSSHIVRKGGSA